MFFHFARFPVSFHFARFPVSLHPCSIPIVVLQQRQRRRQRRQQQQQQLCPCSCFRSFILSSQLCLCLLFMLYVARVMCVCDTEAYEASAFVTISCLVGWLAFPPDPLCCSGDQGLLFLVLLCGLPWHALSPRTIQQ